MNKEMKSLVKKTAKIACATCVGAGVIAILTSSAALKAISEGGKYLVNTVKKIVNEQEPEEILEADAAVAEENAAAAEETPAVSEEDAAAAEEVPAVTEEAPEAAEEEPVAAEI